jgi:hypothetical protein
VFVFKSFKLQAAHFFWMLALVFTLLCAFEIGRSSMSYAQTACDLNSTLDSWIVQPNGAIRHTCVVPPYVP